MSESGTTSTSEIAAVASKQSLDVAGRDKPVYAENLDALLSRLGASSSAGLEESEATIRVEK
jgi:hypothetical protein